MNTAATDVWLNSGPGQRLDGGTPSTGHEPTGGTGAQNGAGSGPSVISSEDMQIAMAISASMGGGEVSKEAGGVSGGGSDEEDQVARAIALSLSQGEPPSPPPSSSSSSSSTYTPRPVPDLQPNGPDVVRVQVSRKTPAAPFQRGNRRSTF